MEPASSNSWASTLLRLPAPVRATIGTLWLALSGASWLFYAGPFRWIAELQFATIGQYSVELTAALALLLIAGTLAGIAIVLARLGVIPLREVAVPVES